ncbi:MAG: hypothetical protein LC667_05365 [Thioalkalivibrio sp.]|nr:hypothetical protein [Thioalkalivibrio sp.]
MSASGRRSAPARLRAAGTAFLLLVAGAALGVTADRLWVAPAQAASGMALTPDAMSARLGLSDTEAARLSTLLDSLHTTVTAAAAEGPEALRAATDAAHRRIAASLRPSRDRPSTHGCRRTGST